MQIHTLATALVSIVIAILVIGLVAVPVIEESTQGTPYTGENASDYRYSYFEESPSFVYTWNGSTATTTIDGTAHTAQVGLYPQIISDSLVLRSYAAGHQYWNFGTSTYTVLSEASTGTLTVTDGSWRLVINGGSAITGTMEWALASATDGDWGQYSGAIKTTLGQKILAGHLIGGGVYDGPKGLVEVTDGVVGSQAIDFYSQTGSTITAGTATITTTWAQTGDGQSVGHYTAMSTVYGTSTSDDISFFAPVEFTSTATGDGGMNGLLLTLIPTLLFVVGIMMAVRIVRDA